MPFEIEVKKNALLSTQFYIDDKCIRFNNHNLLISHISGYGYFTLQQNHGLINTGKAFILMLYLMDQKKPVKLMGMYAFGGGSGNNTFELINENLWKYVGSNLMKLLHTSLMKGEEIRIDTGLRVTAKCAYTAKPGLFRMGPEIPTEWKDIETNRLMEDIIVRNKSTRKKVGVHHMGRKNVLLFESYCKWLQQNPGEMYSLQQVKL